MSMYACKQTDEHLVLIIELQRSPKSDAGCRGNSSMVVANR